MSTGKPSLAQHKGINEIGSTSGRGRGTKYEKLSGMNLLFFFPTYLKNESLSLILELELHQEDLRDRLEGRSSSISYRNELYL